MQKLSTNVDPRFLEWRCEGEQQGKHCTTIPASLISSQGWPLGRLGPMSKAELVDLGCQVGLCCNDSDYSSEDDKSSINM